MKYDEKNFEGLIEAHLLENGYTKRAPNDYDKGLCVDREILLNFLQATQENELAALKTRSRERWESELFSRLDGAIREKSLAAVIKDGFSASGVNFRIAYRKPDNAQNPATLAAYAQNVCSVVRQVRYSVRDADKSLDMVIFLNGVAVFSVELKNKPTGQNVRDAIRQYRFDRNPSEKIFTPRRLIAHFAVDNDEVFVCTALRGKESEFLPFNRGLNDGSGGVGVQTGAGNPAENGKMKSAYFWERILEKNTLLRIVFDFVQVQGANSNLRGEKRVIFPRYHQFDLVDKLVRACVARGVGQRFLVQHSAGSGKSNSIAYLAHQLTGLRDGRGELVFNSVIVVTDRRVLDRQINDTVRGFSHTQGVIEHADKSRDLKKALEDGRKIIISTIQKFPSVAKEIHTLGDKNFAIIIDEAHSSQSGEYSEKLNKVISRIEMYETMQERIVKAVDATRLQKNASYFAFTATPKAKTLEMFGEKCVINGEEKFTPFHLYSMKQAIEEGFILDVLGHYTTYKSFYQIVKTTQENPSYNSAKAKSKIRRYVEGDTRTIEKKAQVIVEHFLAHSQHKIGGRAKAMVVTSSRENALKYYFAIRAALANEGLARGLKDKFRALIAFSGDLSYDGDTYSEAALNGFNEASLPSEFKKDENRFLIVAEKYQTGFDEPLLHTMYVDKKLSGINAVQTLSRLNRKCAGKVDTCVLDFANDTSEIERAFSRFYEATYLREASDVNVVFDELEKVLGFGLYERGEAAGFLEAILNDENANTLHTRLDSAVAAFNALEDERKFEFNQNTKKFIKVYGYLKPIMPFVDVNLEANFVWLRFLLSKLPSLGEPLPREFLESIDLELYRLEWQKSEKIKINSDGETPPGTGEPGAKGKDEKEPLDKIVQEINEKFSDIEWGDNDKLKAGYVKIRDEIFGDADFRRSVMNTDDSTTKRRVERTLDGKLAGIHEVNEVLFAQLVNNTDFKEFFVEKLFGEWLKKRTA